MGYVYLGALVGVVLFFIVCIPLLPILIAIGIVIVMIMELIASVDDMLTEYVQRLRRFYVKVQGRR